MCVGAFVDGAQVGFARIISDYAVFAYLADVFVLPGHEGQGVAKAMMMQTLARPERADLNVFWLATQGTHSLYEQLGFQRLTDPGKFMAILGPEPAPFPKEAASSSDSQT